MALGRKKEIFIGTAVIVPCLIFFSFAFFYRKSHKDPGRLTCRFENIDSSDLVSVNIKSNYFDAPVLRTSVPPSSISVDLRNLVPGTLYVKYDNRELSDKTITVRILIGGREVEKRELVPSSRMVIPLE